MTNVSSLEHDPPPSPTDRQQLIWLGAAIIAPPLLWTAQLLVLSAFSNYACFPADMPQSVPILRGLGWLVAAFDVLAIIAALVSAVISLQHYRRARARIARHRDPLSLWHLDRWCFMAMAGILSSSGFLVAIIFETIASLLVPTCGR